MVTLKLVPIEWLDLLVIGLFGLAFMLTLKIANLTYRLDKIKKESASAEAKLKSFQEQKDKEISDIKKLNDSRIEELNKTISDLKNKTSQKSKSLIGSPQVFTPIDPAIEKIKGRSLSSGI